MSKEKKRKDTKQRKIKGIKSTIAKTKNNNLVEHEQVCHNYIHHYVKYGLNVCKFVCLQNNTVNVTEGKINF